MAPTYTNMDRAVFTTLLSQLPPQQIEITPSISISDINNQFVDEFQSEKINNININNTNDHQENGLSGLAPGYHMGRQPFTNVVTIPLIEC